MLFHVVTTISLLLWNIVMFLPESLCSPRTNIFDNVSKQNNCDTGHIFHLKGWEKEDCYLIPSGILNLSLLLLAERDFSVPFDHYCNVHRLTPARVGMVCRSAW